MIGKLAVLLIVVGALAAQPAANRAGLVIQFADGSVETYCVRFSEPQINGLELLERAAVPIVVQGSPLGAAVCKIGPDGCNFPTESCFCATEGMRAVYWALHIREDDRWTYANLGAANVAVGDGAIHGWAWGTGDSNVGSQPPLLDIAAVCGPVAQGPTITAAPATATPAVPATPTPVAEPLEPTNTPVEPPVAASEPPATAWIALAMIALLAIGLFIARRRR